MKTSLLRSVGIVAVALLASLASLTSAAATSASAATTASCRNTRLTVGSTGPCVKVLQQRLASLGYFRQKPSGSYGGITREAEKGFETMAHIDRDRNRELDISGVTDAVVWRRLASSSAPRSPAHSGIKSGRVVHAIGAWHLERFPWENISQAVDKHNRIVRRIPYAGNAYVSSTLPKVCTMGGRISRNIDVTLKYWLYYYTRMCPGRGVGAHAIPINVRSGAASMSPSGLGKPVGRGIAPMSHGCDRMPTTDAKYIYKNGPGHKVFTEM